MKKFWVFLALIVLTMGCSQDTTLPETPFEKTDKLLHTFTSDELKFLSMAGKETRFGQEDIDRIAGDAAGFFETFTSSSTRSSVRTVSKITPLRVDFGGATTRSEWDENVEELFYVVDFDNDAGYALISGDSRLPDEVLINVGHGSFPEGEIENPGLALMLEGAENYAAREIAKYERWRDSMEVVMTEKFGEGTEFVSGAGSQTRAQYEPGYTGRTTTHRSYDPWEVDATSQITPMIPVEWGQGGRINQYNNVEKYYVDWPFNRTVEALFDPDYIAELHAQSDPEFIPAGCVAIALVQLMAYWRWPTSYHGLSGGNIYWGELCEWSRRKSDYINGYREWSGYMKDAPADVQQLCADLIWHIGDDVGMNWGVGGSGTDSAVAIDLLEDLCYTVSSEQNYNYNAALASINAKRPVYIHGYSHRTEHNFLGITWDVTYQNGHAWLIDGYLKRTRPYTITTTTYTDVLDDNGEIIDCHIETYISGTGVEIQDFFHNNFGSHGDNNGYYVKGIFDASDDYDEELPSNTRSGENGNYQYNLKMWTNIHK